MKSSDRRAAGVRYRFRSPEGLVSRAFVKEDGDDRPARYPLPDRDDPGFPAAAARALIRGADQGDTASAEDATGYYWGDPRLLAEVARIRAEAIAREDDRTDVLATRYLRAAGAPPDD